MRVALVLILVQLMLPVAVAVALAVWEPTVFPALEALAGLVFLLQ
jgi:F0F1-type ATP synthase assembly protein I